MKKWLLLMGLAAALAGCARVEQPVMETIGPGSCAQESKTTAGEISVMIPEEAVCEAMAPDEAGKLYTWDNHTLQLQTMDGGDIRKTVRKLTGLDYDDLTVMSYQKGDLTYHKTVWCAAGEDGTLMGRALVADDGAYHYCVSLLSPEDSDSAEVYDRLCASFAVTNGDEGK